MLNISSVTRRNFKRHFISNAFIELRFAPHIIDWNSLETEFKKISSQNLQLEVARKTISAELRFETKIESSGKTTHAPITNTKTDGLVAQNKENTFSIQVKNDRIIFSTQRYSGFVDLWEKIEHALSALTPLLKLDKFNWIGIRKINEIAVTNDASLGYTGAGMNKQIFTPINDGVFKPESVSLGYNRYELTEGNTRCIIDSTVRKSTDKSYLLKLDLDFNQKFDPLALSSVKAVASELNTRLFEVFVWSISDDVLKALEAE
ncbi:MAG: hypothetical protein OM95_15955 [Bdellovibrio sp. ArHS]|uniref:TIGR04255 family protein n=1 Tax=Bdellovibrio sp. ArHS TaxID=1569284 RepID=UPI000583A83E|nr:TIGR04255 family protein [Bdellovibrio sp. ArHS]KHD87187.1 MAG: hypothetical protein OM95_15955 [Bdellovibrio sp. ArHS]